MTATCVNCGIEKPPQPPGPPDLPGPWYCIKCRHLEPPHSRWMSDKKANPDESKERIERAREFRRQHPSIYSDMNNRIADSMVRFSDAENQLLSTRVEKLEQACKKALTCASLNSDVRNFIQSVLTEKHDTAAGEGGEYGERM